MGGVTHTDVAAYVLGVLDEDDRATFEAHLIDCPHCQLDLLEMYDIPEILDEIGKYWPEPPIPQPRALGGMLDALAEQRVRRRRTGRLAVAAAILLIIAGPLVTVALRSGGEAPARAAAPVATSVAPSLNAVTTPSTTPAANLFSGGQSASALQAQVVVQTTSWGSQVDLILGGMAGPQQCALVAVPWAGPEQTVTTWTVPAAAQADLSQPLRISGGTALASTDIARFEIRNEGGTVLATIPR